MQFYYENDENYVNLSISTILGAAIGQGWAMNSGEKNNILYRTFVCYWDFLRY